MGPWLRLALAAACTVLAARPADAACYGSPVTLSSYSSFQYAAVRVVQLHSTRCRAPATWTLTSSACTGVQQLGWL